LLWVGGSVFSSMTLNSHPWFSLRWRKVFKEIWIFSYLEFSSHVNKTKILLIILLRRKKGMTDFMKNFY
jgi:hypothetical protein